jgi:hypothetical protein
MRMTSMLLLSAGFATGVCATSASASLLQRAPVADAPIASSEHYTVEFENQFVRVQAVVEARVGIAPRDAIGPPACG